MLLVGFTVAIGLIALGTAIAFFIQLRKTKGVWQVGILFVLEAVYAFGYGLELASNSLDMKIFYNHIQYLAIPFIAVTWIYIANKFHQSNYQPKVWKYMILLIVPVFVMVSVQLTYFTPVDWYYTSEFIDNSHQLGSQTLPVLVLTKGPLYYISTCYNLLLTGYVIYRYGITYKKSLGIHKNQALSLMIISIGGFLASGSTLFSKQTYGLDYSFYLIVFIGYYIIYAMFKYELFDLKPSAHFATFEWASEPVFVLNDTYELISWNKAAEESDIQQSQLIYHMPLDDMFFSKELIMSVRDNVPHSFKIGNRHYVLETIALKNKRGYKNGYLLKFNDMTNYIERIEKLDYQASYDELTKILNRRAFIEEAQYYFSQQEKERRPYAMMMIDLDDFKHVNDTYGHYYGDLVLEETAHIIKELLPEDSLFGRYGGEEFLVLLKNSTTQDAMTVAETMRAEVSSHDFSYNRNHISIQISIGVCSGEHCVYNDVYSHVRCADQALYESKRQGKNRVTGAKSDNISSDEMEPKIKNEG